MLIMIVKQFLDVTYAAGQTVVVLFMAKHRLFYIFELHCRNLLFYFRGTRLAYSVACSTAAGTACSGLGSFLDFLILLLRPLDRTSVGGCIAIFSGI
jgi:hypothetical protein